VVMHISKGGGGVSALVSVRSVGRWFILPSSSSNPLPACHTRWRGEEEVDARAGGQLPYPQAHPHEC
jgi:hypothetical protein